MIMHRSRGYAVAMCAWTDTLQRQDGSLLFSFSGKMRHRSPRRDLRHATGERQAAPHPLEPCALSPAQSSIVGEGPCRQHSPPSFVAARWYINSPRRVNAIRRNAAARRVLLATQPPCRPPRRVRVPKSQTAWHARLLSYQQHQNRLGFQAGSWL